MNRRERRAIAAENGGWGPWHEGSIPPITEEMITGTMAATGCTREQAEASYAMAASDMIVINNVYQVAIREHPTPDGFPDMIHLSIKRRDREVPGVERFRDFQRIKNELVGPEHEAVELYPMESRLADSANQFHLWVLKAEGLRFPFGFADRLVTGKSGGGSKQRPFDDGG